MLNYKEAEIFTIYDRGLRVMGDKKDKKKFFGKYDIKDVFKSAFVIIVTTFIGFCAKFMYDGNANFKVINEKISNIESSIQKVKTTSENNEKSLQELSTSYKEVSTYYENLESSVKDLNKTVEGLGTKVAEIDGKVTAYHSVPYVRINPDGVVGLNIKSSYENIETILLNENKKIADDFTELVAIDQDTGTKYTIPVLSNETIIMNYESSGENVYFKGQFNEEGFWNGNCVINRYKDGKLSLVMDAVYDSGKLLNYKQIFPYETTRGNKVWVFSCREVEENDSRSGYTLMYYRDGDKEQSFSNDSYTNSDIFNADEFLVSIGELRIEGYYSGYTSDGKFNDDSGDAYIAKYDNKGNIRYLYVGKIKDGLANDQTGNAWSIAWGYANDGYHYYKGTFTNGEQDKKPKNWYKPMTQEEIEEIVDQEDFDCELTGLLPKDA